MTRRRIRAAGVRSVAMTDTTPVSIHADRGAGRLEIAWDDGHETTYDTIDPPLALPVRVLSRRGRACPAGSTAARP